ncbi:uncharacterized protein LOC111704162 [Eurytemora carolleeae]|uniref:uncharacterized protein LOC111704162 n=1 Tax=Eurytemora carolleeae TaxID=1294199 RepID=UPI000C777F46|nr:uncharacterized protein LOC111704162 [Eurytemora carolleeae]|eukprot:XP_023332075.1 uncharacterized protein LOC111704162 [Eurytemora affinis]
MKYLFGLSVAVCLMCLSVDSLNPAISMLGKSSGSRSWNENPWDSTIHRSPVETDLSWLKDPADEGRSPCVGLCYTLKLLKMAEMQNKQKRFDGYLYDFYRK